MGHPLRTVLRFEFVADPGLASLRYPPGGRVSPAEEGEREGDGALPAGPLFSM